MGSLPATRGRSVGFPGDGLPVRLCSIIVADWREGKKSAPRLAGPKNPFRFDESPSGCPPITFVGFDWSLLTQPRNSTVGSKTKCVSQAAVVAVRSGRICLITSSSGKRWLLPKGNLQRGCDLRETAAREAWEEAGIIGLVTTHPLGQYEFTKMGVRHEVVVFRMNVSTVKRDWPERRCRQREWLRPHEAAARISHASLRDLVLDAAGIFRAA